MSKNLVKPEYYKIKPDWKFKRTMKENRMKIVELSSITGVHRNFISQYTNGRYVLDPLERRRIAKAFGMTEDEVFDRKDVFVLK